MKEKPFKITALSKEHKAELKEKSSVFIASAFPVYNEEDFENRLKEIKKEHYKARHHCYAFKLPACARYSDAGEPTGTAGIRILNAIDHFSLQYTGIIVTRYFGGIKLGVGPLGKAYYEAAFNSLADAHKKEMYLYTKIEIIAPLTEQYNIYNLLSRFNIRIQEIYFDEEAKFTFEIQKEKLREFMSVASALYNIKISAGEEFYA